MLTMRQSMEDEISGMLSSVVEDISEAVNRNISGAQLLHELLSAPWLRSLLRIYECLMEFQRIAPSPFLPYASGLSEEIMTIIQRAHRPSAEAKELYNLLSSPHVQALLSSHDSVAQSDYLPVLPPLPDELPEDEEAMRIVCLVKNNQPLTREVKGRTVGGEEGMSAGRWSSLRRLTLERLIPARRAWSGEELRLEARASLLHQNQPCNVLPRYGSTGNFHLCPQNAEVWKQGLNRSAPAVFNPHSCSEGAKPLRDEDASREGISDDYAYPPPPVPAYSMSLPSSPLLHKRSTREARDLPTAGRTPVRVQTAPAIPEIQPAPRQQGGGDLLNSVRQHWCRGGANGKALKEHLNHPQQLNYSTDPHHNKFHNQTNWLQKKSQRQQQEHHKPPPPLELNSRCSMEELRTTVQTVASSIEHSTQDVRHLGQKMVAATEMITDRVEENAQALNLLAEVVDKLQGILVSNRHLEASPPSRQESHLCPVPPPRGSSLSPKLTCKPLTPHPRPSSPSSASSSSSSSSASSFTNNFTVSLTSKRLNGGTKLSKRTEANTSTVNQSFFLDHFEEHMGRSGKGATIKRNEESGDIYVARVIHGGLADRSGLLFPGDVLVEVNGNSVAGLEPGRVIQILTSSKGTVLLKVIPNSSQVNSRQKPVYMRAMVDYRPQQDSSIPCPVAGMSFSRGDLLEVVDQSDGQWWQARKLPCGATFAGLIPSASMLKSKQREQWFCQPLQVHTCIRPFIPADHEEDPTHADDKRIITDLDNNQEINFDEDDYDFTAGVYLAGFRRSFRLWRRTWYKKRRQSCTSCSPSSNVLSSPYEEVALYQRLPQESYRLIVLIGASGVGVNELRKRLIKLNPSTFQGPVPYTTRPMKEGELAGREYHFVTKELFEYMLCNNKFVEYGEGKGHMYGMSIDAVDEVLKKGQMCIIDVEPPSVHLLRCRNLKPYVIFIKAPNQERLRQTRRNARIITNYAINRAFTVEDLLELEETSQMIEAKYKQYFDSTVVNDDLQDACMQLCSIIQQAQNEPQWIPVSWLRTDE